MGEGEVVALLIVGVTMVASLRVVVRAWVRKKELEHSGGSDDVARQLDDIRFELEELRNEQRAQAAEMHERIDFTERLLTSARSQSDSPPGSEQSNAL
jgi:hypothetical protein